VVNGRPLFVKGANWWVADILLDLPKERYQWLLEEARAAGIQMLRVNGASYAETQDFYSICDRMGIMVWNEFPKGNSQTPDWPQDVWEAQVLHIIFSIRNHPSLALYSGGNEFNPYTVGNSTVTGIVERSLADFDGTRPFRRTSEDAGDVHTYPDMDPTWYGHLYRWVPFISETGLWTMPEPQAILEVVDKREFEAPLSKIESKEFADSHPEFVYHFMEYALTERRVVPMLSRASQIDDVSAPNLESLSEAVQMAAGEFNQIISDTLQANYPVTVGYMPWVFNTPWPLEFFMLADYFGQPVIPYYSLKRTYEPTHILARFPHLIWAGGEKLPISISIVHSPATQLPALMATVEIFDDQFHSLWRQEHKMDIKPGPSVASVDLGEYTIPVSLEDRFLFLVTELKQPDGKLVSRSVYWPRCLKLMNDAEFRKKYRESPQPSIRFDHGPWLKKQVASAGTSLQLEVVGQKQLEENLSRIEVRIHNTGARPAFPVQIDIAGTKRAFYATDNFFWLAPHEERVLDLRVLWRDPKTRKDATLTVRAWNAELKQAAVALNP
jgi:beta-mannosidase